MKSNSTETLQFYNENAQSFVDMTREVKLTTTQDRFLSYLPEKAKILDFGCGSGRDSRYFLSKGYQVEAVDGSSELCRLASEYAGIKVKQMLFQELEDVECYDGIWACSSILHLDEEQLIDVLKKIHHALTSKGYLYTSFKYGEFEGVRHGRYFYDLTEERFQQLLEKVPGFELVEQTISTDARPGRENEKWLNLILRKRQ